MNENTNPSSCPVKGLTPRGQAHVNYANQKQELAILQEALNSDILDVDSVLDMLMSSKIEKIKKKHPYAITAPATPNGRWQTTYKDISGKRKNIKAPTEEALLRKLIPVYFPTTHIDKLTFYGLYEEWIEYKSSIANSANTIKRHRQHYKKYLLGSALHDKRIKAIDELLLEKECNRIVREFNLTRKECEELWNKRIKL